jgi:hypothetical protein
MQWKQDLDSKILRKGGIIFRTNWERRFIATDVRRPISNGLSLVVSAAMKSD